MRLHHIKCPYSIITFFFIYYCCLHNFFMSLAPFAIFFFFLSSFFRICLLSRYLFQYFHLVLIHFRFVSVVLFLRNRFRQLLFGKIYAKNAIQQLKKRLIIKIDTEIDLTSNLTIRKPFKLNLLLVASPS